MWTDDWIGIPWAELGRGPDDYDCLGLFLALQKVRHGRALQDPCCTATEALRRSVVDRERHRWTRVENPQEGDALMFRVRGHALHIAYALPGRMMLHSSAEIGESAVECMDGALWSNRLEGIYRYAA